MSQEILYTSAPQGLKPGSRGFCTVVSTSGMAANLAERLESLSGYRHAYAAHEERAGLNPVNYSHFLCTVGGRKYHVLSSIRDAGMDYTQRSNKLAHHVALEESECVPGGPACVLAAPGFCETEWDGETKILPTGRKPRRGQRQPAACQTWKALAGDAGWAGVLAQSALVKGGRPISVIYPPGTDVLPLVVEALSLVPPERRWDVTFSTYFTKLPAGTECQWRFLLDGTPEAQVLRRDPHATLIDLCRPRECSADGDLVEVARLGRQVLHPVQEDALLRPAGHSMDTHEPVGIASISSDATVRNPAENHGNLDRRLAGANLQFQMPVVTGSRVENASSRSRNRSMRKWLIASIAACGLLLLASLAIFLRVPRVFLAQGEVHESATSRVSVPIKKQNERDKSEVASTPHDQTADRNQPDAKLADKQPIEVVIAESEADVVSKPLSGQFDQIANPGADTTAPISTRKSTVFKDVDQHLKGVLLLPSRPSLTPLVGDKASAVATLNADEGQSLELKLITDGHLLDEGRQFVISKAEQKDDTTEWTIEVTPSTAPTLLKATSRPIGKFTLKQNHLDFGWVTTRSPTDAALDSKLLFSKLRMTVSGEDRDFQLIQPLEAEPIKLDVSQEPHPRTVAIGQTAQAIEGRLFIDLIIEGLPDQLGHLRDHLTLRHLKQTYGIQSKDARPCVDFEISIEPIDKSPGKSRLSYQLFAYPRYRDSKTLGEPLPTRWIRSNLDEYEQKCEMDRKAETEQLAKLERAIASLSEPSASANTPEKRAERDKQRRADESERKHVGENLRSINENILWSQEVARIFDTLQQSARIHYEIYFEIDKERVVIVRTRGYDGLKTQ